MCGRFALSVAPQALFESFHVQPLPGLKPRYNIAPTQLVAAVLRPDAQSDRQMQWLQWGLIPPWAKDPKMGARMINARSETVLEKPSFRAPFRRQRCLIPSDGFFEWKEDPGGKQPVFICKQDRSPFAFAGLWESWAKEGQIIYSCTILTTQANELLKPLHERMPVILQARDYEQWLDPSLNEPAPLLPLLVPHPAEGWVGFAVNRAVNNAKNDSPECIQPLES